MAGQGSLIGEILGGAAGSVIPGLGTAAGSTAGNILGGTIDSLISGRKEEASTPMLEDPTQRLLLEEIRNKRRSIEQGTDVATQAALGEADLSGESTRNAVVRATGGNAAQTIDALLKTQRLEDRAKNAAIGTSQSKIPFLQGLEEQLTEKISQRALDLNMFNRVKAGAEKAQFGKEALMNLMAGNRTGAFEDVDLGIGDGLKNLGGNITDLLSSLRGGNLNVGSTPPSEDILSGFQIPGTVEQRKGR